MQGKNCPLRRRDVPLISDFYADDEMIRDAINGHSGFNLIHLASAYKVDVFIPKEFACSPA